MAETRSGAVMFKSNPITLAGPEIKPGATAPDFAAVDSGLQPVKLSGAKGKVVVLSSVPSLETPVCDTETRRFNQEADKLGGNVEVWTISMDLPFAQKRWCGAAGVTHVKTLSDFRDHSFSENYGVLIKDGPLAGLTARAVFVVGKDGKVAHAEYVKEITTEPNYEAAHQRRQEGGRRLTAEPRAAAPGPGLDWVFAARIDVGEALTVGQTPQGLRRVVPILGGSVEGPGLRATVLAGRRGLAARRRRRDGAAQGALHAPRRRRRPRLREERGHPARSARCPGAARRRRTGETRPSTTSARRRASRRAARASPGSTTASSSPPARARRGECSWTCSGWRDGEEASMELHEAMRTTFACRDFTGDPLPDETLFRILDRARFAPSGGNRQGWRVIVVRDPATRKALADLTAPAAKRYAAQQQAGENPVEHRRPDARRRGDRRAHARARSG